MPYTSKMERADIISIAKSTLEIEISEQIFQRKLKIKFLNMFPIIFLMYLHTTVLEMNSNIFLRVKNQARHLKLLMEKKLASLTSLITLILKD